jgi:hypothetical protein
MKKLLALLSLAVALVSTAAHAADARTVLSTTTKAGNTITSYVGRVQGDPAADGSLTLTIFPLVVKTDSEGTVISSELSTNASFTLTLTPQQFAGISAAVKAAFTADQAAKFAQQNPPPAPAPETPPNP